MGILLKCRIHDSYLTVLMNKLFHEALYQLGSAITHDNILAADPEVFTCQQRIHRHATGILCQELVKVGTHLVTHSLRWEKRIDQITEVQHFGETPVPAVPHMILVQTVIIGREYGLGNILILHIIDFVPRLVSDGQRFEISLIQQGNHTQDLLVILIIAHHLAISVQERHIDLVGELLAELVDINCFIIGVHLRILESLLGNKVDDVVILVDTHHRTIHPGLILSHEGQIRVWIVKNHLEEAVVKNQIALNEQCVILNHLVLDQCQGINIVGLVIDRILGVLDM